MTWTNLGIGGDIHGITIDPRNTATIYVAQDALYKSTDGGRTWTNISPRTVQCCGLGGLAIDPRASAILYATDIDFAQWRGEVFRSTDAGGSWAILAPALAGPVTSLTLDWLASGTLYAATTAGLFAITLDAPEQTTAAGRGMR